MSNPFHSTSAEALRAVVANMDKAIARLEPALEAADYIHAIDGFGILIDPTGPRFVSAVDATAVGPTDTRRFVNGLNERASVTLRSDAAGLSIAKCRVIRAQALAALETR